MEERKEGRKKRRKRGGKDDDERKVTYLSADTATRVLMDALTATPCHREK